MTSPFTPIDGFDGVYTARSGKLSCTALRLRDGTLCLYSPVAGLEQSIAAHAAGFGTVSVLLAPNHYHNKGLAAHVETFPEASLCCSANAAPRLSKITGLSFDTLDGLKEILPDGITLHEPDGLKTGEVWVQIASDRGCALIVTDAFSSASQSPGQYADKVTMLTTFPRYGVKDKDLYKSWATHFLTELSPATLIPCHGSPVRSPDLTEQMMSRLNEAL